MGLRSTRLLIILFVIIGTMAASAQIAPVPPEFSCDIILYEESFENGVPTDWSDLTLDSAKLNFFNEGWVIDRDTTFTSDTGPYKAKDGDFYAYCDGSGPIGRGELAMTTSPLISIDMGFRPGLTFYLNMFGQSGSFSLNILHSGGMTTALGPIPGDVPNGIHEMDEWEQIYVDLNAFRGEVVQLQFVTMKPQAAQVGDIAIDGISICSSSNPIPTLSEWSLIILSLSILILGVVGIGRSQEVQLS